MIRVLFVCVSGDDVKHGYFMRNQDKRNAEFVPGGGGGAVCVGLVALGFSLFFTAGLLHRAHTLSCGRFTALHINQSAQVSAYNIVALSFLSGKCLRTVSIGMGIMLCVEATSSLAMGHRCTPESMYGSLEHPPVSVCLFWELVFCCW